MRTTSGKSGDSLWRTVENSVLLTLVGLKLELVGSGDDFHLLHAMTGSLWLLVC